MAGMNSWLIWQRVILFKLHTVIIHHAKIRSKNYLPKGSMSKQERHLWEPKHFACHLNRSNHFAKRLKVNASVQDVKRRLLVSHYLVDHIKGRDPRTVRSRSGLVQFLLIRSRPELVRYFYNLLGPGLVLDFFILHVLVRSGFGPWIPD